MKDEEYSKNILKIQFFFYFRITGISNQEFLFSSLNKCDFDVIDRFKAKYEQTMYA